MVKTFGGQRRISICIVHPATNIATAEPNRSPLLSLGKLTDALRRCFCARSYATQRLRTVL